MEFNFQVVYMCNCIADPVLGIIIMIMLGGRLVNVMCLFICIVIMIIIIIMIIFLCLCIPCNVIK